MITRGDRVMATFGLQTMTPRYSQETVLERYRRITRVRRFLQRLFFVACLPMSTGGFAAVVWLKGDKDSEVLQLVLGIVAFAVLLLPTMVFFAYSSCPNCNRLHCGAGAVFPSEKTVCAHCGWGPNSKDQAAKK